MYVIHAHFDASQTKVNILVLHSLTLLISSCEKNSLNGPYFTLLLVNSSMQKNILFNFSKISS